MHHCVRRARLSVIYVDKDMQTLRLERIQYGRNSRTRSRFGSRKQIIVEVHRLHIHSLSRISTSTDMVSSYSEPAGSKTIRVPCRSENRLIIGPLIIPVTMNFIVRTCLIQLRAFCNSQRSRFTWTASKAMAEEDTGVLV